MDCWEKLGIEGTADVRAVKRAYAVRLKKTRPDDDPQGFLALRRAYDTALAEAQWISATGAQADVAQDPLGESRPNAFVSTETPLPDSVPDDPSGDRMMTKGRLGPQGDLNDLDALCDILDREENRSGTAMQLLDELLGNPQSLLPIQSQSLQLALLGRAGRLESDDWRLPVLERAARHFAWLGRLPPSLNGRDTEVDRLRACLAKRAASAVEELVASDGEMAARAMLEAQLASPDFSQLDNRHALFQVWIDRLLAGVPTALEQIVCDVFMWGKESDTLDDYPGGGVLRQRMLRAFGAALPHRIAKGETSYPGVSREIATLLVRPRIGWRDWFAATRRDSRQVQVRAAMNTLSYEVPGGLDGVAPKVRAWWAKPRPTEKPYWAIAVLICCLVAPFLGSVSDVPERFRPLVVLVLFFASPLFGYAAAWSAEAAVIEFRLRSRAWKYWLGNGCFGIDAELWKILWIAVYIVSLSFALGHYIKHPSLGFLLFASELLWLAAVTYVVSGFIAWCVSR